MEKSLSEISKKMSKLDICMLTTQTQDGMLISRPMSNNGEVEYDGNSWFFSYENAELVTDINQNKQVNLTFTGKKDLYISVTGEGNLIKSKAVMEEHWLTELKQWFKDGIDTPGIILIQVVGKRIKYWQRDEEGEVKI